LESTPEPAPPPLAQLCHAWALAHVEEYVLVIHTLTLSTHVAPSDETMGVLCFLHPAIEVDLPPFMDDFHPEMKVILNRKTFIFVLAHSPYFFPMALWIWCMNFYQIVLLQMILRMALTSSLKYVGTLFKVMFHL
jgi:hypothetical protein